jgi:hypothetical protein
VFGITILLIGAFGIAAVIDVVHAGQPLRFWGLAIAGALWILVVGVGYFQDYSLLRRFTGRRDPPRK